MLLASCAGLASGVAGMEGGVQAQDQDQALAPELEALGFWLLTSAAWGSESGRLLLVTSSPTASSIGMAHQRQAE